MLFFFCNSVCKEPGSVNMSEQLESAEPSDHLCSRSDLAETVSWVWPPLPAQNAHNPWFYIKASILIVFFSQEKHNWLQLQKGWVITIVLFFSNFLIDLRQPHATSIGTIIYDQQQETAKFKHWYTLGLSKFRLQGHNLKRNFFSFWIHFFRIQLWIWQ